VIGRALAGGLTAALLFASGALAFVEFPWKADDKPPAVNGLMLGDSEQRALDLLGPPDEVSATTDGELLEYRAKGLEVTATREGVTAIRLRAPEAGSVDGIKVGDIARSIVMKWGMPQSGEGRLAHYGTGRWIIAVRLADKAPTIVEMTVALNRGKPPAESSKLNAFQTQ
jgi:hypothetical protein